MRTSLIFSAILLLAVGCGGQNEIDKKRAELESLRTQRDEIESRIHLLETELKALDSSDEIAAKLIKVEVIKPDTFLHFIEVQGNVDSDHNVMASPEQPGVVKAIFVREGDYVTQGQLLAQLENTALKNSLAEVEAALELATTTYQKTATLWEQGIGSEMNYLQAKTQKESMEKRVAALKAQLAMTQINAPISGYVDDITFRIGEMANPGMSGIRVVNNSTVKVKAQVADAYVSKVKTGAPVYIDFPDLGISLHNKIRFVSRTITPGNRSLTIEVELPNPDGDLRPNMVATVRINDEQVPDAVCVPSNVVQRMNGEYYVMLAVEEGGKTIARRVIVTPGTSYGGRTLITSGINPGDRVITQGFGEVADGQPVKF